MDTIKITEAIQNGFTALLEKLGIGNKAGEDSVKVAFNEFATSITNAIKESNNPDETSIKNLVDAGITNAIKNFATKDDVKTGIEDALKNVVNKNDLNTQVETLKNAIIEKLGDASGNKKSEEVKKRVGNKWGSAILWSGE